MTAAALTAVPVRCTSTSYPPRPAETIQMAGKSADFARDVAAGRMLLAAWRHLQAAEFRVLASLLELGPPGTEIELTDIEIGRRNGYGAGSVQRPLTILRTATIPGTDTPWISGTDRNGPGRIIWVNPIPEGPLPDAPVRPARGPDRNPREKGGEA